MFSLEEKVVKSKCLECKRKRAEGRQQKERITKDVRY